jgi:hypothetical protein
VNLSLVTKLLVACNCLAGAAMLVATWRWCAEKPRRILRLSVAAIVATRGIALAVWIFAPRLIGTPDLMLYYLPQARKVLSGLVPGVDFPSSYSPLFTYLTAAPLLVWDHPASLVALILAFEALGLIGTWCGLGLGRAAPATQAIVAAAYALNPVFLWYTGVAAYQGAVIFGFFGAGLWLFHRSWLSAGCFAAALPFTKLLAVLAWPTPTLRRKGTAAAVVCIAAASGVMGLLYARGLDFISPLLVEARDTSNGNLWMLLGTLVGRPLNVPPWRWLSPISFTLVYGIALAVACRRRHAVTLVDGPRRAAALIGLTCSLFLLLSKKSLPMYYTMFLPLLLAVLLVAPPQEQRRRFFGFTLLGATSLVTPQLWHGLGQPNYLTLALFSDSATAPAALAVLLLDTVTVGLTCWVAWLAWREVAGEPGSRPVGSAD